VAHSDRLYLRCSFCDQFVLIARTNANTSLFADWREVEAFMRLHLKCNPYHVMENLCGVPGFEVTAWSEATVEDETNKNHEVEIPRDLLDELGLSDEGDPD
jgi:hypothetical protein